MVKILLACSAGMSTSMMVSKMKQHAKSKGIEAEIWAVSDAEVEENLPKADILMLGPQIRFLESRMKSIAGDKPVVIIDTVAYGTMNGEKVLEQALELIKK